MRFFCKFFTIRRVKNNVFTTNNKRYFDLYVQKNNFSMPEREEIEEVQFPFLREKVIPRGMIKTSCVAVVYCAELIQESVELKSGWLSV